MKGLLKVMSPFAPDQSGAASVFYDMNAITVICDAGGCTGNVCGFDEPRWHGNARPIFSAGLRDMDAILGRDDKLVEKLKKVSDKTDADFAAIIGTPVPAVIATDYRALKRMAEKRCGIPVVTCECTGTNLYDEGEELAYMELFKSFTKELPVRKGRLGIIGATPLNLSDISADRLLRRHYEKEGYSEVMCYGMGDGLESIRQAASAELNIVVSPSGLAPARWLEKKYGTPYRIECPLAGEEAAEAKERLDGRKVLIVHNQVLACSLRDRMPESEVTVASFFKMDRSLMREGDVRVETEDQFMRLVAEGGYDTVICDELLRRAVKKDAYGEWINARHFAVSGNLEERLCEL